MGPLIGDVFEGRFRIDAVVGEGGFATVYRARDTQTQRDVALKVIRTAGAEIEKRFWREVRAVAGLRDPHTVRLFDYGTSSAGQLYTVFEYLEGRDLSTLLAERGPLDGAATIGIARQLLESLREAHAAGLVHRDIKPENVRVLGSSGASFEVKLIDFGIAKPQHDLGDITRDQQLVGTPRYMSPEQLLQEELTPASDLYSLGLVMLEMLVGRDAMHGGRLHDQIDRLQSGHLFAIPTPEIAALSVVVGRMTARRPEERYPSAQAVLDALAVRARPTPAPATPPTPAPPPPTPPPPPRPATRPAAASVLVVAGLALAGGSYLVLRPSTPVAAPPANPRSVVGLVKSVGTTGGERAVTQAAPAGCSRSDVVTGLTPAQSMVGLTRVRWVRYIPRGHVPGTPLPLVVLLSPNKKEAETFFRESGFAPLADAEGFAVLAPNPPTTRAWYSMADNDAVRKIVTDLQEEVCIDDRRIYVVGHISGGHGAERLTCEPWIAAGVASSSRPEQPVFYCESGRPVPFAAYSPMKTDHARPEGGVNCAGDPKIALEVHEQMWRDRNGCSPERSIWLEDRGSTCWRWACSEAPFVSCHLDGGHPWPGEPPRAWDAIVRQCDGTAAEFPSARVAWDFVKPHRTAAGLRRY